VSYTALPPGSYTFEVTSISRENLSTSTPAAIHLRLNPFFWQTTWFLVLLIVAGAAIIAEITRRRTRVNAERQNLRFQERASERERIAYQIHDTVIQDMIGTALQLELLGFQITEQPEKANSMLDTLAHRLRETIARSRNMVWSLHSTAVVQYSLVEVLRHAEAEFRLGELPRFELTSAGEPRDIHPLVRDEVYRICREALANAFRHSNAESVRVIVRFLPDVLEVEIEDDGQGIDEEIRLYGRPGHFGLPGMQAHAQRIGADITIVSEPGEGTTIHLRVKTQEQKWKWLQARFWTTDRKPELLKGRQDDSDHGRS
jgi:signal transduction histidine kinase